MSEWIFSKSKETITHGGWACIAKSDPVAGHTPIENGTYALGPSSASPIDISIVTDLEAMGPYFIQINTSNAKGLHGGGTGLANPLAARQGWLDTEGCIRVQNVDLYHIVLSISPGDVFVVTD